MHHILPTQDLIWFPWLKARCLLGSLPNHQSRFFLNCSQGIQRVILVSGPSSAALCPEGAKALFMLALGPGTRYAEPATQMGETQPPVHLERPGPARFISKGTVCAEPTCQTTQDFANQRRVSGPVL